MPDCELVYTCPYFNDGMYEMPEMDKERYCRGDYAWCGRYMVVKALERELERELERTSSFGLIPQATEQKGP